MTTAVAVAGAVLATSAAGAGAALVRARTATVSGTLLVGAGVLGAAGGWLAGRPEPAAAGGLLVVAAVLVLAPAALVTYPDVRRRPPVDAVLAALVVLPGCAALVVLASGAVAARDRTGVAGTAGFVAAVVFVVGLWWRIERAGAAGRGPLVWLALGTGVPGLLALLVLFAWEGDDAGLVVDLLLLAVVPVVLPVGVLRGEVVDVRGLVVGGVVLLVLLVGYVAVFVGAVSVVQATGAPVPPLGVLAVLGFGAALLVRPAGTALRGVVDRMLFGDRPDPLDAAARVAGRIGDDPAPALDAVRDALAVPWLALEVGDEPVATSGTEVTATVAVPVPAGEDLAGTARRARLVVGLRPGDLRLTDGDRRVLRVVAPLLGQVVRARALAQAVQASRGQVVAAVEDERRRLRRDLHDGLGPTLTGVAFTVDAARNTLRADPDAAARLLDDIRADTVGAIELVRRIVYGMRPPALDELGLVGALRQRAAGLRGPDGAPLAVTVEAAGPVEALPAAVEVAAYRIVVEALTNAARHAGATRVDVRLAVDAAGALVVEVRDDGAADGAAGPWRGGVGLASMRERAAEVGGAVEYGPTGAGGRVLATLPL